MNKNKLTLVGLGFLGLAWALVMRYYTMSSERHRVINLSVPVRLCISNRNNEDSVPWLKLFKKASFWACVLAHACQNNCFFVLLSWLPTYFHDGFPQAKVRSIFDIDVVHCRNLCNGKSKGEASNFA